jgi:hypothetical protein
MFFMMSNELTNMLSLRFARILLALAFALGPALSSISAQTTPFIANDRVQLLPIDHSLKVAEPNEIPLRVSNPNVKSVVVNWGVYKRGILRPESAWEPKSPEYSLLPSVTGASFIHFTPTEIGKLNISILVFFQDGGFARKDEDVEAVLPDRSPEKLIFPKNTRSTWNANWMYAIVDHAVWLDTVVYYPGFDQPIHLPATDIVFHVLNEPGREPLQLDSSTGTIKPVAAGRALVQADFAGLTTFVCVRVFASNPGGPWDDCHDLLPPGESLPPEEPLSAPPRVRAVGPSTSR